MTNKSDYRIFYHSCHNPYYEVHKVYYNEDGSIKEVFDFTTVHGENVKELQNILGKMLMSDGKPVIDFDSWKEIV
jgi:hypothetical protein